MTVRHMKKINLFSKLSCWTYCYFFDKSYIGFVIGFLLDTYTQTSLLVILLFTKQIQPSQPARMSAGK